MIDIQKHESPNYSHRGGFKVTGIVIHYTGDGPDWNPVKWLCMPAARASSHYVIERDGTIHRLVKLTDKAWHAGSSEMMHEGEMTANANQFTIGIELANCGKLIEKGGRFYWNDGVNDRLYRGDKPVYAEMEYDDGTVIKHFWEPYHYKQLDALGSLLVHLRNIGYEEAAGNLIGHEEIAMPMGRKSDPGPLFPWARYQRDTRCSTRTKAIG